MDRPRVLVVDRDVAASELVKRHLAGTVEVTVVASGNEAVDRAKKEAGRGDPFEVVLVDFDIRGTEGISALKALQALGTEARLILTSAQQSDEAAVAAVRHGAYDFISKPVNPAELRVRVERALRDGRGKTPSTSSTAADLRRPRKSDVIIGGSAWTKQIYERISMAAPTDVTVAIYGESGTGKELVARTIHALSRRWDKPFIVMNCGAIPENLLEDELFGHVRGAFTDASKDREGLLAAADEGTLFLDEIGEMPPSLQVKLLRVLQSQEFRRVGDNKDLSVDVRILTATNRDLEKAVQEGSFRQDLYYRINVFPLTLPPLRDRKDDIPLLAHHFLVKHRDKVGKKVDGFTAEAMARLMAYSWPGNVRELENKVHHALVLAQADSIRPEEVQQLDGVTHGRNGASAIDVTRPFRDLKRDVVETFERDYARELLRRHAGNLAAAARQARMDRKNLWALVKKYEIDLAEFRRA